MPEANAARGFAPESRSRADFLGQDRDYWGNAAARTGYIAVLDKPAGGVLWSVYHAYVGGAMRTVLTLLVAFAALAAMFAGPLVLLPVVGAVESVHGRGWGFAALAAAFGACAGALWGLARVADRRTAHLEPSSGPAPRDRLFCQRCGAPAALYAVVCDACGSTRLGPGAPAPSAVPAPAAAGGGTLPLAPARAGAPAAARAPAALSVLRRRGFALLWVGQLVSACGDYVLLVALPYHVYERTGSGWSTPRPLPRRPSAPSLVPPRAWSFRGWCRRTSCWPRTRWAG